jgi:hypothetical protein
MRSPRYNPRQSAAMRNQSMRERMRLAGDRVTGVEKLDPRFTSDEGRSQSSDVGRRGSEGRGVGKIPISGVDVSGVTEGAGGAAAGGRARVTGGEDEGNYSVYPRITREMLNPLDKRKSNVTGGEQEESFSYTPGMAQRVSDGTSNYIDPIFDYLGGKPTQAALAQQFGVALDKNQAAAIALRMLPATAAVGTVLGLGNLAFGGEGFGNVAMDSLGMGVGAYGINRGINSLGGTTPAGAALRYTSGAIAGKVGMDLIQLLMGGGASNQPIIIREGGSN